MPRHLSIDVLRGFAIVLMVQVHFVDNLSYREDSSAWLYDASVWLGGLPAPLFTFVSGLSFSLWARSRESAGQKDAATTRAAVRRGAFLFALGIAFNVLVWLPEDAFNWDILTLIGSALIILAFARKLPLGVLAALVVVILLVSPPIRIATDYPAYWVDYTYDYDFAFKDVVFGFIANGYFPLLPWLAFPAAGFIVGEAVFPRIGRPLISLRLLAAIGIGLLALAAAGAQWGSDMPYLIAKHYANGLSMYPASTVYVAAMLGFAMLMTALLRRCIDQNPRVAATGPVLRFLRLWSSFSLTVYIVHHIAHLWPLWLYGILMGQDDPQFYWRAAMSAPAASALALAFMVAMNGMLIALDRHRRFSLESALRRICD